MAPPATPIPSVIHPSTGMNVKATEPNTAPTVAPPAIPPATAPVPVTGGADAGALIVPRTPSSPRQLTCNGAFAVVSVTAPGVDGTCQWPLSLCSSQAACAQPG